QAYELPSLKLSIAPANSEVVVQPTDVIAAQQIKAEEKQRVFGVIPDFYTSYVWNAAPLDTKQKYSMALRDTFDPMTFVGISIGAGIEQANNAFPGYGQGAAGYGKRWGALFANGRTSDILSRAVFSSRAATADNLCRTIRTSSVTCVLGRYRTFTIHLQAAEQA